MSGPLLEIENLRLRIGAAGILRGVSLAVSPGEILALVGESGSGKSLTLLSALRLAPEGAVMDGKVRIAGRDVGAMTERDLCALRGASVGMVFQEPATALNPVRTIGAQVAETILLHQDVSRAEARRRAVEALQAVGLDPARIAPSRYPHELSGGQRQRAAIAIATALHPPLILADEPTTALDVTTQAQIMALLSARVRQDGAGMVLVTHDLGLVASVADRIAIMKDGEIVEQGPCPALLQQLRHPYARSLLAAAAPPPRAPSTKKGGTLLSVRDARVSYRGVRAVDGVSFELAEGESLAIVGESGSGKSSLARAVLGLEPLSGGDILLDGQAIAAARGASLRAYRRKVQMVFQDPAGSFDPRWRVEDIVCEPFHLLERPPACEEKRQRARAALDAVGLPADALDRRPHAFSGGQRQRIAIARALIISPKLVVLDEAVSALDVSIRAQILALLADLRARLGLSYLFITHDLSIVRAIADRVIVMQNGRIVEDGAVQSIFDAPRHPYTQALLAATPRLDIVLESQP